MTPEEAAFVLEPIWLGFAAARWRLAEIHERVDPTDSALTQARHAADIQDASTYLATVLRNYLCPESGGLLTALKAGAAVHTWPNAYPPGLARTQAEIRYFAKRFEAELGVVQPLQVAASA